MESEHGDILVSSDRLIVRRPEESDIAILQRVFGDPEMMRTLGETWTPEMVADTVKEWRDEWGYKNRWSGVLVRKGDSEVIGTAGLSEDTVLDEPGLEMSWFVLSEHQGQGFAAEITVALLRFAFEHVGAERVIGETHPENRASTRVLEKSGFTFKGRCQHAYDFLPGFDTQSLWVYSRAMWWRGSKFSRP